MNDQLYRPTDVVILRTPLLPLETALSVINTKPDDLDTVLLKLLANPIVREAILVASPDLYLAIDRWKQNPAGKRARRARQALTRYILRMASRPTPYGVFAGVATGLVRSQTHVQIAQTCFHRTRTRPDVGWMIALISALENQPEIAAQLRYFVNHGIYSVGDRLVIPNAPKQVWEERTTGEAHASLRNTAVVCRVLELARNGIRLADLQAQLHAKWPQGSEQQISHVVATLRQVGALQSELRLPLTNGHNDILAFLQHKLDSLTGIDNVRSYLSSVADRIHAYDRLPLGQGVEALEELRQLPRPTPRIPAIDLAIDLRSTYTTAEISVSVVDELARGAEILARVSTATTRFQNLARYRQEFIARYGIDREVPLLTLLDEEIGLGPPPSYEHPRRNRPLPGQPGLEYPSHAPTAHPHRDRTLIELAVSAFQTRQREVVLDESLVERLQVIDSWRQFLPDSVDLFAYVAASSSQAVDRGDFRVVLSPRVGDRPAGRSFGRFLDLLNPATGQVVNDIVRSEEVADSDRIYAELSYLPNDGHQANISLRPQLRQYEITVGVTPSVPPTHTIELDDLLIGVQNDRFYIWSISHEAEVVVCDLHLLNYYRAPNVCRFLAEVCSDGSTVFLPFDWGAASYLPCLPRLRVGRFVLAPAEWHISRAALGVVNEFAQMVHFIRQWRDQWDVPRCCFLKESDNKLLLDLENDTSLAELWRLARSGNSSNDRIVLQEVLPDFDDVWVRGEQGRHVIEIIAPLRRTVPRPAPISSREHRRPSVPHLLHRSSLGSNWLFAKLYAPFSTHESLLIGPVRDLVRQVARYAEADLHFFIRYADPDPHLRLRFRGDPHTLVENLLPRITRWAEPLLKADLVDRLVIDAYDREIERYGGPAAMPLVEALFGIDSQGILDILTLRHSGRLKIPEYDILLLSVDDLVSSLGFDIGQRRDLYQRNWQTYQHQYSGQPSDLRSRVHRHRMASLRAIGDRHWLRAQDGGETLNTILTSRRQQLADLSTQLRQLNDDSCFWVPYDRVVSSIIHMHCNRLVGINRDLECEALFELGEVLESLEHYVPDRIIVR